MKKLFFFLVMLLVASCFVFTGCEGLTPPEEEEVTVEWEKVFCDTSSGYYFKNFMVSNDDDEIFFTSKKEDRRLIFFHSTDGENWVNLHPLHNNSGFLSGCSKYLGCLSSGEFLFSSDFHNNWFPSDIERGLFSSTNGKDWDKISDYQFSSICENYNGKLYGTRIRFSVPWASECDYESSAILYSEQRHKGSYWSLFALEENDIEVDEIMVTDNLDLFVTAHDYFRHADDDRDQDDEKKYLLKFPYERYQYADTIFVNPDDHFHILGIQRNNPLDTDDDRIIIASPTDGVIESTDKGKTWQENSDPVTSTHKTELKFYQDKPVYLRRYSGEIHYYDHNGDFITAEVPDEHGIYYYATKDFAVFKGHIYALLEYEIWRTKDPVLSY